MRLSDRAQDIVAFLRSGAGGSDQYAVNDQVNGTFLWAYGVTDRDRKSVV